MNKDKGSLIRKVTLQKNRLFRAEIPPEVRYFLPEWSAGTLLPTFEINAIGVDVNVD